MSLIPSSTIWSLSIYAVFALLTLYFFWKNSRAIYWSTFGMAFMLGLGVVFLIPFLWLWDEQFHALVAKHISEDPLHPKLMNFALWLFEGKDWDEQATWLHKQPFFLYAIAFSVKIFGAKVWAVRLPSLLMYALTSLVVYDFGTRLKDKKVGLFASWMFIHSFVFLELLSGKMTTDHNDAFFLCLILLSFWAHFRFTESKNGRWLLLTGLFVGWAILTKWLVGLLVFAPWGIQILASEYRLNWTAWKDLFKALGVAIFVALPWQVYTLIAFPETAQRELSYNQEHFWVPLEGHRGDFSFHWLNLLETFRLEILLLTVILLIVFWRKWKGSYVYHLVFSAVLLLTFYSLAATKMYAFIAPSIPLFILAIAFVLVSLLEMIPWKKISNVLFALVVFWMVNMTFRPDRIVDDYGLDVTADMANAKDLYWQQMQFIRKYGDDDPKRLIINANMRGNGNIPWMFFTENKAIRFIPTTEQIQRLKKEGFKLTAIRFGEDLPEYVSEDSEIEILEYQ